MSILLKVLLLCEAIFKLAVCIKAKFGGSITIGMPWLIRNKKVLTSEAVPFYMNALECIATIEGDMIEKLGFIEW